MGINLNEYVGFEVSLDTVCRFLENHTGKKHVVKEFDNDNTKAFIPADSALVEQPLILDWGKDGMQVVTQNGTISLGETDITELAFYSDLSDNGKYFVDGFSNGIFTPKGISITEDIVCELIKLEKSLSK